MAEGLIKFTYREGAKTPPVISEWLRAKPEGMSYPEYLNVVLIECLTDEDSAERVAQNVAAGASQAAGAASGPGVGVSANEIRSIVSDDGELTREAIRGLSAGVAEGVAGTSGEVPADVLSTGDAEAIAKSLIEAVERDGEATRKAMESLSQTLVGSAGGDADEPASSHADADLERIVTRLKDSILTDGQKTREMLAQVMEALPSADGPAEETAAATAGTDIELRETLRSDMLDMVATIRQDSQTMRDDLGRVVAEATGNQTVSFDEGTAQFFGNLHRGIANVLAKIDTMQAQVSQVQKTVSDNHDAIWADMRQQEQAVRDSYDDVIAALDRIEGGSLAPAGSKDEDLLPEGMSFAVPDDLFSGTDSATAAGTAEESSEKGIDFTVPSDAVEVPAGDTFITERDGTGPDFAGLVDVLEPDDSEASESGLADFNPFGDVLGESTSSGTDTVDEPVGAEGEAIDHRDSLDVAETEVEPALMPDRMLGGGRSGSEPAAEEDDESGLVDEAPTVPMTDPRNDFLNEDVPAVPHAMTDWDDDVEAPYGGLRAADPEPVDEDGAEKKHRGSLNDMLRSLLG